MVAISEHRSRKRISHQERLKRDELRVTREVLLACRGKARGLHDHIFGVDIVPQCRTRGKSASAERAQGLLLHPSIDRQVDETVVIQRHAIRFATVNLAGDAASICDRLLELAGPWGDLVHAGT